QSIRPRGFPPYRSQGDGGGARPAPAPAPHPGPRLHSVRHPARGRIGGPPLRVVQPTLPEDGPQGGNEGRSLRDGVRAREGTFAPSLSQSAVRGVGRGRRGNPHRTHRADLPEGGSALLPSVAIPRSPGPAVAARFDFRTAFSGAASGDGVRRSAHRLPGGPFPLSRCGSGTSRDREFTGAPAPRARRIVRPPDRAG